MLSGPSFEAPGTPMVQAEASPRGYRVEPRPEAHVFTSIGLDNPDRSWRASSCSTKGGRFGSAGSPRLGDRVAFRFGTRFGSQHATRYNKRR